MSTEIIALFVFLSPFILYTATKIVTLAVLKQTDQYNAENGKN